MGVIQQFAKEGVLLGQQNFDVLHTHSDYPGADVWLESVDALVGERGEGADTPSAMQSFRVFTVTACTVTSKFRCERARAAHARVIQQYSKERSENWGGLTCT